jgi:DNA polymerase III alpha subunit
MEDSLGAYPEVFSATRWIAEECNLELELGRLHLPRYPLPPGERSKNLPAATPPRKRRVITTSGLKIFIFIN